MSKEEPFRSSLRWAAGVDDGVGRLQVGVIEDVSPSNYNSAELMADALLTGGDPHDSLLGFGKPKFIFS